jgi:nitrite transporter NirC
MPISISEALKAHEDLSVGKAAQARSSLGRYLLSSMLAGAYVGVAVVLLVMVSAPLVAAGHPFAKLVQGGVFGIALTLVVFAGAELFTGNNMIMLQGLAKRAVKVEDVVAVWVASLIGNFIGSVGFALLVDASGIVTTGAAQPGTPSAFQSTLGAIALGKAKLMPGQLFFRAVLCNMLVCLALWMAARAASDGAKLIVLWWGLLAFIASGFEHSIANMTSLSLAAMTGVGEWSEVARNLLFTIPGNVVGGSIVGLAYAYVGSPAKSKAAPALPDAVGEVDPAVLAPVPARAPLTASKKAAAGKAVAKKAPAKRVPAANGRKAAASNGRG